MVIRGVATEGSVGPAEESAAESDDRDVLAGGQRDGQTAGVIHGDVADLRPRQVDPGEGLLDRQAIGPRTDRAAGHLHEERLAAGRDQSQEERSGTQAVGRGEDH
jgi:hypothetical protein